MKTLLLATALCVAPFAIKADGPATVEAFNSPPYGQPTTWEPGAVQAAVDSFNTAVERFGLPANLKQASPYGIAVAAAFYSIAVDRDLTPARRRAMLHACADLATPVDAIAAIASDPSLAHLPGNIEFSTSLVVAERLMPTVVEEFFSSPSAVDTLNMLIDAAETAVVERQERIGAALPDLYKRLDNGDETAAKEVAEALVYSVNAKSALDRLHFEREYVARAETRRSLNENYFPD